MRDSIGFLPERSLATALGDYGLPGQGIERPNYPLYPQQRPPRLWDLRPLDVSAPLMVRDPPPAPPRLKVNRHGIPGDIDEMLAVLEACLQVGKLDRVALVLKRLGKGLSTSNVDMPDLHNRYLQASVDQILANPGMISTAEALHAWYELEIRGNHVEQTPETIAYMLKVSLLTARGSRLERLVNRYMGMVSGDSGLAVLYTTGILTDQDLATITNICRTYNFRPEDVVANTDPAYEAESLPTGLLDAAASSSPAASQDVLSTPQKGLGLRMLKQTLSLFSEIPDGHDIAKLPREQRREIQARLERDCVDAAVARWREENQTLMKMGLNTSLSTASLSSRLYEWQNALEARLAAELESVVVSELAESKSQEDMDRCIYGPFLQQSAPSRLAAVTILSTLGSMAMHGADKGVPIAVVILQLAKVAEEDIKAQQKMKELNSKGKKSLASVVAKKTFRPGKQRLPRAALIGPEGFDNVVADPELYRDTAWPLTVRTKLGAALLSALIETAKVMVVKEHPEAKTLVSQLQPAFTRTNKHRRGKKIGMVLPNQMLVDLMKREPRGDVLARHLPMVVEPEPWSRFDKGGFLASPSPLVRVKDGERDQMVYAKAAIARGDMDQMLRGLDVLGRTAWNINKPVFDVMLQAWNDGEAIADIPALHPDVDVPAEPASSGDPLLRRQWIKAVKQAENERSGLHSVRCFMNFQLEIARAFKDQTFYFPHNIDFRGRAYPIPTYLNHMGADHVRGLLSFAKGKELGEAGLRWLKVHLTNVFGNDKASLDDRESFASQNWDNIVDSANDPLGGQRWWLKAEDPWQCLAACLELKAALESPDPTRFVSHLPIHQDGTCNGLQHYAALGGDTWGARQVNLEPGDRPADVYSAVAELVKEGVAEDLKADNPLARAVQGKVTRKVVKQTVMTNVYGVTFSGAKKQVLRQLDSLYPDLQAETRLDPVLLASYIATKIFKALSTMFSGAHDIQYWLGEIGRRVCRSLSPEQLTLIADGRSATAEAEPKPRGRAATPAKSSTDELLSQFRTTLVWTTPLRMPVVQPYRKTSTRIISTCLQNLSLSFPDSADPVNKRKQLQGFPPNFIHSLDATHMILSALECDSLGLTFAAVHDSFWTHAADVSSMNHVIRDSFIRIHSEDVIGRLAAEFRTRYGNYMYLAEINPTSTAAKAISAFRKSRLSLRDELLLEKKRLDLLQSADPKLVKQGKEMTTPGSLFSEMSSAEDMAELDGLDEITLGGIPFQERAASAALEKRTTPEEEEATIPPEDAEDESPEASPETRLASLLGTGHFDLQMNPTPRRPKAKTMQIWLPLTLPPAPRKGEFDVQRTKTSDYFFS